MHAEHATWWRSYWERSGLRVPNAAIERQWYLDQYKFGAATRRGAPPITLQGPWTADDGQLPPWKGDYHNDLNTQTTYIAYQAAGLFEAGESFLRYMSGLLPEFRAFATSFYGVDGAVVPGVMAQDGRATAGWAQYSLSPTNGAWVSHLFARHWRYTRDPLFLEREAYPFCRDVATALAALLVGWVIVLAGLSITMVMYGVIETFGIMFKPLAMECRWDRGTVSAASFFNWIALPSPRNCHSERGTTRVSLYASDRTRRTCSADSSSMTG